MCAWTLDVPLTFGLKAVHNESIRSSECAVRRAIRADVPERRSVRGESVPAPLAGRLRLPGLREPERGSAQVGALRPPVPRLPEADLGDGRYVHAPLACAAEGLASGAVHHDLAFERDVGLAAAAPSGLGKLQDGLDASAEDPPAFAKVGDGNAISWLRYRSNFSMFW